MKYTVGKQHQHQQPNVPGELEGKKEPRVDGWLTLREATVIDCQSAFSEPRPSELFPSNVEEFCAIRYLSILISIFDICDDVHKCNFHSSQFNGKSFDS